MDFPSNVEVREVNVGDVFELKAGEEILLHFVFTDAQYISLKQGFSSVVNEAFLDPAAIDVTGGYIALFDYDHSFISDRSVLQTNWSYVDGGQSDWSGDYYAYFSSPVDCFIGVLDDNVSTGAEFDALDIPLAVRSFGMDLTAFVSNLDGVDISSSSNSVKFLKTKLDYVAFDSKKITANALDNSVTTTVNSTSVSLSDGNDTVIAFAGNDTIDGGKGNDTINADDGNNNIKGGAGSDSIMAGTGNDKIDGGDDVDVIDAGDGVNTVTGGKGEDSITAGTGNDKIDGGDHSDVINAGDGDNTVTGGNGTDLITAGNGNDKIDGGDDADVINAGDGVNTVTGGKGTDLITAGNGNDKIDGGDDVDVINAGAGDNNIKGGKGNDTINAGEGNDTIDGGANDDVINAGDGNNKVIGGAGSDSITAGAGNDSIDGGADNDTINGGAGDDTILGGAGDDVLFGSRSDVLTGGAGNDKFILLVSSNLDDLNTVKDFKSSSDKLIFTDSATPVELDAAHLVQSATSVFTFADELPAFGYNTKTGALFYDADGSGVGEQVQILLIANKAALVASDILI